jgi:hypothetical protein
MKAIPGDGSGPTRTTSTPIEQIPEVSALSSMYPERRVSLPISTRWRRAPSRKTWAQARPSLSAVSEVIVSTLARPRTPSVPNIVRFMAWLPPRPARGRRT